MSKANREQNRRERAAAIQKASARAERNRRMGIVGGVVVILAIIIAGGYWYASGGSSDDSDAATEAVATVAQVRDLKGADPKKAVLPGKSSADSPEVPTLVIGKKSAKVKVVVYEDFLCPYCRQFETASRDFLHIDAAKGEVLVNYRPFHLLQEQYSTDALNAFAAVLKSSSPKVALKFHDLLYDNQPYESASSFPSASDLGDLAEKAGADGDKVARAVEAADPSYEQAVNELAQESGLRGTPTIFVNGSELSGRTVTDMAQNLEKIINKAYPKK